MSFLKNDDFINSDLYQTNNIDINSIPNKFKNIKTKVIIVIENTIDLINTLHATSYFMTKTIPIEILNYIQKYPETKNIVEETFPNMYKHQLEKIYFNNFIKNKFDMNTNGIITVTHDYTKNEQLYFVPRNSPYAQVYYIIYGVKSTDINHILYKSNSDECSECNINTNNLYDDVVIITKTNKYTSNDDKIIHMSEIQNIQIDNCNLLRHQSVKECVAVCIQNQTMYDLRELYRLYWKLKKQKRIENNEISTIDYYKNFCYV